MADADYSWVKDGNGQICGTWLADPVDAGANRTGFVEVLLVKGGASTSFRPPAALCRTPTTRRAGSSSCSDLPRHPVNSRRTALAPRPYETDCGDSVGQAERAAPNARSVGGA